MQRFYKPFNYFAFKYLNLKKIIENMQFLTLFQIASKLVLIIIYKFHKILLKFFYVKINVTCVLKEGSAVDF